MPKKKTDDPTPEETTPEETTPQVEQSIPVTSPTVYEPGKEQPINLPKGVQLGEE